MLRIVVRRFGDPAQVLSCEPMSCPEPEAVGVVVRMLASPINPSDLITVSGAYPHRTTLPFVPGFEGVGVVDRVGKAVTGLREGQRVLPLGSTGGWQTFKAVPADWCVPVPSDLTDDQAAMAYINPLTARLMLRSMAPAPGALVGINAASSAIGRMLLRMAHSAGVRSIAVVRSARARQLLKGEPALAVLVQGESLPLLDGGFDAVGGTPGMEMALAIKPGGVLAHYGLLSGMSLPAHLGQRAPAVLRPFWLRQWVHSASREELKEAMARAFEDIRAGMAVTDVEARYALTEVSAALAHNSRAGRRGKILLAQASA